MTTQATQTKSLYTPTAQALGLQEAGFTDYVHALEQVFRNTYDLYLKSLFYHWNFKGTSFLSVHPFLEEQYTWLAANLDAQAERLRIIGLPSRLPHRLGQAQLGLPDEVPAHDDLFIQVRDDHYVVIRALRKAIEAAEGVGDVVLVDLLTTTLQQHEKAAWFCDVNRSR
jgi:starvation-inducible DNA-binding protein